MISIFYEIKRRFEGYRKKSFKKIAMGKKHISENANDEFIAVWY